MVSRIEVAFIKVDLMVKNSLFVAACVASFCLWEEGGARGLILHEFEHRIPPGYEAWTNDADPQDGWHVVEGALVQTAANDDTEPWGDRYLIGDAGRSLVPPEGRSLEFSVDLLCVDLLGSAGLWLGLGLYLRPESPTAPGRVFAILEKSAQEGATGLRIHSGGWRSELIPYDVDLLRWHRLRVRLEGGPSGRIRIAAGVAPAAPQAEVPFLIETLLPETVDLEATGLALGTAAQYGFTRNPLVAFDNFAFSEGELPASVTALAPATVSSSWFGDPLALIEALSRHDSREAALEKAFLFRERFPDDDALDRLLFAEMRLLRDLKRWEEARAKANEIIERFPTTAVGRSMGGRDGRTEDQAAEDYALAVRSYRNRHLSEAIQRIDDFIRNYPDNWRVPEARQFLCYALHHTRSLKERFFDESNKLINEGLDPNTTARLLFLQATQYVIVGEGERARPLIDHLEAKFPGIDLGPNVDFQQLRLESYLYGPNPYHQAMNAFNPSDIGTAISLLLDALRPEALETKPEGYTIKNFVYASLFFTENAGDNEARNQIREAIGALRTFVRSSPSPVLYEHYVESLGRILGSEEYDHWLESEMTVNLAENDIQRLSIVLKSRFERLQPNSPREDAVEAHEILDKILARAANPEQEGTVYRAYLETRNVPGPPIHKEFLRRFHDFAERHPDSLDVRISLLYLDLIANLRDSDDAPNEDILERAQAVLTHIPSDDWRKTSLENRLHALNEHFEN